VLHALENQVLAINAKESESTHQSVTAQMVSSMMYMTQNTANHVILKNARLVHRELIIVTNAPKIDINHQTVLVSQEWSKLTENVYLVHLNANFVTEPQNIAQYANQEELILLNATVQMANTLNQMECAIIVHTSVKNVLMKRHARNAKETESNHQNVFAHQEHSRIYKNIV
jgi:hypothetical protein